MDYSKILAGFDKAMKQESARFNDMYSSLIHDEPFEEYLKTHINENGKAYIYQKDHPFLSSESLNDMFKNVWFVQHFLLSENDCLSDSFVVILSNSETYEEGIKNIIRNVNYKIDSKGYCHTKTVFRVGFLKCLYSEMPDPFQETMNQILQLPETKAVFDENNKDKEITVTYYNKKFSVL